LFVSQATVKNYLLIYSNLSYPSINTHITKSSHNPDNHPSSRTLQV
jgi:hypothetical protein